MQKPRFIKKVELLKVKLLFPNKNYLKNKILAEYVMGSTFCKNHGC